MNSHEKIKVLSADSRSRVFTAKLKELENQQAGLKAALTAEQKTQVFSYEAAFILAKEKKPFVEGEKVVKPILEKFADVFVDDPFYNRIKDTVNTTPLSNNTISRRIEEISGDMRKQVHGEFKKSEFVSLAIDESTDVTSQPQLLIYARFISNSHIAEELLGTLTLQLKTTGQDIFDCIDKFFTERGFDWNRVIDVNVDGALAMFGKNIGLLGLLNKKYPHITVNHCIIYREALAAKNLSPVYRDVMQVVIKVVNFIKARDLNSRMFSQLCQTEDAEHQTLLLYTAVRWLSCGRMLERVFLLRNALAEFLRRQARDEANKFTDTVFLGQLALLTNVFTKINQLNLELQGKNKYIFDLQKAVRGFLNQLDVLIDQVNNDNFALFPHFAELVALEEEMDLGVLLKRDLQNYLTQPKNDFIDRFPSLSESEYDFLKVPFDTDAKEIDDNTVALELAKLQADDDMKVQFSNLKLSEFWLRLLTSSDDYKMLASKSVKALIKFGTTYNCERAFSTMVFLKNKYRSRITNSHLDDCMLCANTSYKPRIDVLVKAKK